MINKGPDPTQKLPAELIATTAFISSIPVSEDYNAITDALIARFGPSLDAVLLYGSCLHSCNLDDGIADIYVIVDRYRTAYKARHLAMLNACLAPNVFYLEVSKQTKIIRAKYAVISMADFEQGAQLWFHSYIWARFAQPSRLLYTRDEPSQQRIHQALAHAVLAFLKPSLAALGTCQTDTTEIWTQGLMLTYAAELRPEQKTRANHLVQRSLDDYKKLTTAAEPALETMLNALPNERYEVSISAADQRRAKRLWQMRRWQGRILSILRLSKATITFRDCVDYAAWKIQRHTGIEVEITPMLRRHPILWGYKIMWQLLRRGVLR